jgi:hypothetical protein
MPQYQHLNHVGAIPTRQQDHQLQDLTKYQVPERQDHDRQHAANHRSPADKAALHGLRPSFRTVQLLTQARILNPFADRRS